MYKSVNESSCWWMRSHSRRWTSATRHVRVRWQMNVVTHCLFFRGNSWDSNRCSWYVQTACCASWRHHNYRYNIVIDSIAAAYKRPKSKSYGPKWLLNRKQEWSVLLQHNHRQYCGSVQETHAHVHARVRVHPHPYRVLNVTVKPCIVDNPSV